MTVGRSVAAGPVLVVLDGSRSGHTVLARGIELARRHEAELHVVSLGARLAASPESLALLTDHDVCSQDRAILDAVCADCRLHPVPVDRSLDEVVRRLVQTIGAAHVVFAVASGRRSRNRLSLGVVLAAQPVTLCPVRPTSTRISSPSSFT